MIIRTPELWPILVYIQHLTDLRVTSFELITTCPARCTSTSCGPFQSCVYMEGDVGQGDFACDEPKPRAA